MIVRCQRCGKEIIVPDKRELPEHIGKVPLDMFRVAVGLSLRSYQRLMALQLNTVADVDNLDDSELRGPNFGKKSLREVRDGIEKLLRGQ